MICPVEIAHEMSAFAAVTAGDDGKDVHLLEGRHGAVNESARGDVAAWARKITWWQAAEILEFIACVNAGRARVDHV